jgi:hypothetical protein
MELHITNSTTYHEAIVTDKDTAKLLFNMHRETATMVTMHNANTTVYRILWRKDVGNVQPNVDDNLFI